MFDGGEFFSSSTECFSASSLSSLSSSKKKKFKSKNRFTNEQINSLETMFESETKLEPRKKLQVAKDLGLQPRQVAIWFQNKRARYKSKQLEKDYSLLVSNYNNLCCQYESLKKEKRSLVMQVQQLNDELQKSQKNEQCCKQEFGEIDIDRRSDNGQNIKNQINEKPSLSFDLSEHGIGVISDDDSSIKADYFGVDEDHDFLNMVEPVDGTLTSPENWSSLDNDCLLDQPSTNYDWWEFWS